MSASEARAHLPELLTRVENGEEVTITRHGRPVAVLVRPDSLRSRRAAQEWVFAEGARIGAMIDAAKGKKPKPGGISSEYAEELVRAIRADRDEL